MPIVQVRERAQITVPSKIRKALGSKEGDYLEIEIQEGRIALFPKF